MVIYQEAGIRGHHKQGWDILGCFCFPSQGGHMQRGVDIVDEIWSVLRVFPVCVKAGILDFFFKKVNNR